MLSSTTSWPGPQHGGDLPGGGLDVGQVRIAALAQRRGHADQQGVGLGQPLHVGRGLELACSSMHSAIHSEGMCSM